MNSMEKSMLLDELFSLRKADKAEREQLLAKLDRMTEQLLTLNESSQAQTRMIDELKRMLQTRTASTARPRRFRPRTVAPIPAKLTRKILTAVPLPTFLRRRGERTFRHLPVVNRNGHTARECLTNV